MRKPYELSSKELTLEIIQCSKYLHYNLNLDMPMACFAVYRLTQLLEECAGQSLATVINNCADNGKTGLDALNLSEIYDEYTP